MIFHYLVRVWNPAFDQWDRRSFAAEMASSLANYLEAGPDHLHYLMDISDWNLEALRTGEEWRPYRKPRVDLRVLLTSRAGLALEWAPRDWWNQRQDGRREFDFIRFNTNREIGDGHPNNRLFYLKDFGALMRQGPRLTKEEGSLIRATGGFIRSLVNSLETSFDVRMIEDFEILERPVGDRHVWDKEVTGAAIFNVDARAAEKREAELSAWEKQHLSPLGLKLGAVCDAFRGNDRSAAKAARELTKHASKPITTAQARKWLDALERRLGPLEQPTDPPSAKVIEFRPRTD